MSKRRLAWSCDERDRTACRNAHGCHCAEITALQERLQLQTNRADIWHARAASAATREAFPVPTSHLERAQMAGRRRRATKT